MDQSLSGGSGKPSRMTLTVIRSCREFSDMREIIARANFSRPKRKFVCYSADHASKKEAGRLVPSSRGRDVDCSTPPRSLIRYALEIKDPYLGQLVRRVEAGEMTIDHVKLEYV